MASNSNMVQEVSGYSISSMPSHSSFQARKWTNSRCMCIWQFNMIKLAFKVCGKVCTNLKIIWKKWLISKKNYISTFHHSGKNI